MTNRRAVITGIGPVTPIGMGRDAYWESLLRAHSGIRPLEAIDKSTYIIKVAGRIPDFDATRYIERRLMMQTDRFTWLALAATQLALEDSGLNPQNYADPYALSVITSASSGGNEFGQREIQALWSKGAGFVGAFQSIAWFYAASSGQVSILHRLKGANSVVIADSAGGADAIAHARRTLNRGSRAVVTGGTEAPLSPYALTCQAQSGRFSDRSAPDRAFLPFETDASGMVPGEGGAIMVVEDLAHALNRGARTIYGEVVGHAATQDGTDVTCGSADGVQYARAMSLALQRAQIAPESVDVIFADGAGIVRDDRAEARAIHQVFGAHARTIPVAVPKSAFGRLNSGGAPLDIATALLAMRYGTIPPAANLERPDPGYGLNLVWEKPAPCDIQVALVCARGMGGFNSAVVLRRFDD